MRRLSAALIGMPGCSCLKNCTGDAGRDPFGTSSMIRPFRPCLLLEQFDVKLLRPRIDALIVSSLRISSASIRVRLRQLPDQLQVFLRLQLRWKTTFKSLQEPLVIKAVRRMGALRR